MPSLASNQYRHLFANAGFRDLWIAAQFSRIAEAIAMVAMPLYVYDLTGSAGDMSLVFIALTLPRALFSPFSGLIADRFDRRQVMIWASALRAFSAALLPFSNELWQIALIAIFLAIGSSFLMPAELATVPTLVPKGDLVTALSAMQVSASIIRIVVPAGGALLIGLTSARAAFWVQSACIAIAIVWLVQLHLPAQTRTLETNSVRRDIADGFRTVWNTPMVRAVCATEALWSLAFAVLSIGGVVYLEEVLDLGDRSEVMFGFLFASMALGAVLGGLFARHIDHRLGRIRLLTIGYMGPLALVPVIFEPPLPVLFICWFVLGFTDALAVIAFNAYLAESVTDELRGRVYSIWGGIVAVSSLVSFAVTGWFTETFGAANAIGIAGLVVGLGGPLLVAIHREGGVRSLLQLASGQVQ